MKIRVQAANPRSRGLRAPQERPRATQGSGESDRGHGGRRHYRRHGLDHCVRGSRTSLPKPSQGASAYSLDDLGAQCRFRNDDAVRPKRLRDVLDLDRRGKIAFANSAKGAAFLEEFWPTAEARPRLFQPEPGCSSPTFRGSFADVLGLDHANDQCRGLLVVEEEEPPHSPVIRDRSLRQAALAPAPRGRLSLRGSPDHVLQGPTARLRDPSQPRCARIHAVVDQAIREVNGTGPKRVACYSARWTNS